MSFLARAASLAFLLALPVQGAMAQDVEAGGQIARKWCSGCHRVEANPKSASDGIPTFASVANTKGMTDTALAVFLRTPHARMPDYSLTRQEIRDVSAYILSLRK
jgi:mono/diheme cytochrome c family protein